MASFLLLLSPPTRLSQVGLIPPLCPARTPVTGEEFEIWPRTALLDNAIEGLRLPGMLAFLAHDDIFLAAAWGEGAQVAAHAEQHQFRHIAKIKPHATAVRPTVFTYLIPHQRGLVGEPPLLHDRHTVTQQRIGYPEIEVASWQHELRYRQRHNLLQGHGGIAR